MKRNFINLLILFLLIFSILSCTELDEDNLPEETPPTVNIQNLSDTLYASTTIKAEVTDNKGVEEVYFYYNSTDKKKMSQQGNYWQIVWDVGNLPEGTYDIHIEAFDRAGNKGIANKKVYREIPEVSIDFATPLNGIYAYGDVEIELSTFGDLEPDSIKLFADDELLTTLTSWTHTWNTGQKELNSNVLLKAVAYYMTGLEYEATIAVTIGAKPIALGELFTAKWCVNCPEAEAEMHRLEEKYHGSFIVMEYHGIGDNLTIPEVAQRTAYYNFPAGQYPTAIISDGIKIIGSQELDLYEDKVTDFISNASPLDMEIQGNIWEETLTVKITSATPEMPAQLFLHTAIIEDGVIYDETTTYDAVVRDMTEKVELGEFTELGETKEFIINFELQENWDVENMTFIAFVQSDKNKKIIQTNYK